MANLIEDGWLHLTNGIDTMELACREIKWDVLRAPDITHEVGGWNFGYDLGIKFVIVKVSGILFDTNAKVGIFIDKLNEWLDSGTISLKVQRNTGGSFEPLDGTNTSYPMLSPKGASGIQKIAKENGTVYEVSKCDFEQAGAASA